MSAVVGSCTTTGTSSPSAKASGAPDPALASVADRFLSKYVTSDGRVLRRDQGSDVVSEGQAYGMLIAESIGRMATARTIWAWTNRHLALADGLFAWHANGAGQIEDPQSAADADVLLAYALLRYTGPDSNSLHAGGRRVAAAVLENEAVMLPNGSPVLVAGPWAKTAEPPVVDPSYLMPGVFAFLARSTGDGRWTKAAQTAVTMVGSLTSDGRLLPPDWAKLSGSSLVATSAPDGSAGIQYGLDAARLPIWFATSCESSARAIAANWWRNVLSQRGRAVPIALSLQGATIDAQTNPLPLLAGTAAAKAAGDDLSAMSLRAQAMAESLRTPTYYGDAWLALSAAITSGALLSCKEISDA